MARVVSDALLDEVAEAIGSDAAVALVAAIGGERTYVPRRFDAHSAVVAAIGQTLADQLSDAFHGNFLTFPQRLRRRFLVQRLSEEGRTVNEIVRIVGIHARSVYEIRRQIAAGEFAASTDRHLAASNDRQPDLFD